MMSIRAFWPMQGITVHAILDQDKVTPQFTEHVTSALSFLPHSKVTHTAPPTVYTGGGHDRQQVSSRLLGGVDYAAAAGLAHMPADMPSF
jgi:hypothetical protein